MRNLNAELLGQFADQALLWGFSGINLTAGEFPEPRQRFTVRPLSDENPPIGIDQGGGGDQNQRLGGAFGGVHGRERYTTPPPPVADLTALASAPEAGAI